MENNSNKNWFIGIGGVFIFILILLILPINVNKTITFYGKILPSESFIVYYDTDGRFVQKYHSNKNDSTDIKFLTFDRGDNFSIKSLFNSASNIDSDTLFLIQSLNLEEQLIEKQNELNNLEAYRKTLEVGDKPEKLNEIDAEIASLRIDLDNKKRILSRADSLVKKGLISTQEFEILETDANIIKERIKSLEARLQYFKTGARLADIQSIDTQIESVERELDFLNNKKSYYIVKNPFDSAIKSELFGNDTLINLYVPDEYLIVFPILTKYADNWEKGENYNFIALDTDDTLICTIKSIDSQISKINNKEVVLVSAYFSEAKSQIKPGQIIEFETRIGDQKLIDFILENIN